MSKYQFVKLISTLFLSSLFFGSVAQAANVSVDSSTESHFSGDYLFKSGQFTDEWTFEVTNPSAFEISVAALNTVVGPNSFNISDLSASFNGGQIASTDGQTLFFTTTNLTTGTYSLFVSGNSDGSLGGLYAGTISAVPLPAAAWLFGSGLIALLTLARRRNQREQYA